MTDTDNEPGSAEVPNPHDWTDAQGAADLLGRSRATVYDMVDRGVLTKYRIGTHTVYWVPQVRQVREALGRLARRG